MDNLSDWLAEEIKNRGWTIRELARRANLSHTTVADVISGQRQPTWDFCASIAKPLGKTPEEMFRLAGLLPTLPGPEDDQVIKDISAMFKQLTPERRRAVLEYVLFQAQQQGQGRDEAQGEQSNAGTSTLRNAT